MPSNVTFNIEIPIFISGAEPTFGHTGSCFHISGSGMHDVTGLRFSDAIGNKIQLDFSTGLIGAVQTVTGCVPQMAPQDLLTIEAYNSISTGTYEYFEVGEENCVHKCNVEITGTLKVGNIPYLPAGTGFLVFDSTDGNKIKHRSIDIEGITGFSAAAITLTAGSGLVGGGDLTAPRRFDVVAGTGIHVDNDTVNVDSGQLLTTGQGFFNVNKKGLTGDSAVYFLNGEDLDLGVGDGTGIIVNQNSVDINTGLVITTGDAYFNVNAGPGLTGDIKVYLKETLDLGVFVDGDTIQFTGAGDDSIAAFTVVDGGITPEKVSFGFAGSDTKSGAANSVKSPISGGTGIAPFVYSGLTNATIDLSGVPNAALETTGIINFDLLDGITGSSTVSLGEQATFGLRADIQETGYLSGGSGIQGFKYTGIESYDINILAGTGIHVDYSGVNVKVNTGLLISQDEINVGIGTGIYLDGKELNVRNTRGFISGGSGIQDFGFSGDENQTINIQVGTGLSINDDIVNIPVGTGIHLDGKELNVRNTRGFITGGSGIQTFGFSGDENATINISLGTGLLISDNSVHIDTGVVGLTGLNHFHVGTSSGLITGDPRIEMGSFLNLDVGAGSGIIVNDDFVNVNTGFVLYTGDAYFNVNAAQGLTGDTKVYMGDTLDLGVYADGVTIGFTGGGDQIAAFKVLGLQNHLSGGMGLNDFTFSGDKTLTANVGAGTGIVVDSTKVHVNSGQVVLTSGNQSISGIKTFSHIEVTNLLRASGSGIIVNNLHVTESITGDGDAAKVLTENAINISGLTFSEQRFTNAHVMTNEYNQVPLANLTQSAGIEVCSIDFAARQLGNIISAEVELNLSALDIVDLHIMLFVDDETAPRRVWIQQVYSAAIGEVFQGMYFFSVADTNSHTYKVRVARAYSDGSNGEFYINRYYGSTSSSSILIEEIQPDVGAGIGSI